jgi:hypothetical protein
MKDWSSKADDDEEEEEKEKQQQQHTHTYLHTSNPYLKNTPRGGKRMANSTSMKV